MTTHNPLQDITLYRDPLGTPVQEHAKLVSINSTHAQAIQKIAQEPTGIWLGEWHKDIQKVVTRVMNEAEKEASVPIFVLYNIPDRDRNEQYTKERWHSLGGLDSDKKYLDWVLHIAAAINNRPAIVILEPDAVAHSYYFSPVPQQSRLSLLRNAVAILVKNSHCMVYIDADHSEWIPPKKLGELLLKAGIEKASGFSMNVAYFRSNQDAVTYGEQISAATKGKHFVIDTSRNGNGETPDKQWCNPPGRALGSRPTTNVDHPLVDAYLWIKVPGESDGTENSGPKAGSWWLEYAFELSQ